VTRLRTLPEALVEAAAGGEGYLFTGDRTDRWRSYAVMLDASRRAAAAFRELGLGRGDLVALVVDDPEEFLTALFGASLAGLVPASLYPPATASDRQRYLAGTSAVLRSSRARAVVTTTRLVADFADLRSSCPDLAVAVSMETLASPRSGGAGHARQGCDAIPDASLDDIAFVQFTSGSTSAPKGVIVSHRNLSANIDAINGPAGLDVSASDSAVSWLPLYHDMGLVGMALGAMYCGRPAILMTPRAFVKRPAEWLGAISRHRATVSFAPSFAYDLCVRRVKERDLEGLDLSCWRVAGCGGEPIHGPTLAAFAAKFRAVGFRETSVLASYGLAEHVLAATFGERGRPLRVEHLSVDELATRAVAVEHGAGSARVSVVGCGSALPGHHIRVVDEKGRELPERAIGEITLAGPSVMTGYYADEALTARTIRDGWLQTGDLGYLSQGELFVCGRTKEIVIANGRKYHPQDLEWAVDDLAGVRRGRAVAFAAKRLGCAERVVIVLEPTGTVPADALTESIRRRIADVCALYVDEVVFVPGGTISRTTSGKVQRLAIRARYERGELPGLSSQSTTSSSLT
jgi:acyl-CoA synthetase (AMP-forming)/AMP-acid ligase II